MKTQLIHIEAMRVDDWITVAKIYKEGIETGLATFETKVPSWDFWNKQHIESCRLVAKSKDEIVGWAALSKVSSRCVYGGVGEVSVYVANKARGNRVGERLLEQLITESEQKGFWTLQSGIFPENNASIRLHEKAGFRKIGFRERIGQLHGQWKDNILMERRSKKEGL